MLYFNCNQSCVHCVKNQPHLSDNQKLEHSQKYKREASHVLNTREDTTNTTVDSGAELKQYISYILGYIGIDKNTLMAFTKWIFPSHSHPLEPSIFHLVILIFVLCIFILAS